MESNRNFEQFIKEGADQYRMYPSEKVWKGVHNALHTRRRRWIIGFTVLLFVGGITSLTFINTNNPEENTIAANTVAAENINTPGVVTKENNIPYSEVEKGTVYSFAPKQKTGPANRIVPATAKKTRLKKDAIAVIEKTNEAAEIEDEIIIIETPTVEKHAVEPTTTVIEENTELPITITAPNLESAPAIPNEIADDNKTEAIKLDPASKIANPELKENNNAVENFAAESIVNAAGKKVKQSRFSVQGFFTPTISYRKLTENKAFLQRTAVQNNNLTNNYAYFLDVNNAVRHKPDMGLEAGANVRYALSKNISLKAGLQFNVSRYNIRAYTYAGELATIALNTGYYGDSLRTFTTLSNEKGYRQDWLQNLYFQLSAPIGVELRLGGNDKFHYGIAGSVQPTYILGDRSYLLSSDFKNYAEVSWLTRNWNLNTAIEAFVAYNTGKLKWQVGPQIRRQLFSSFVKEYPVKEYPFDVGLKIGIQLNK
jgi:hypothetical protein